MANAKNPIIVILRNDSVEVCCVPTGQVVFLRDYDIEHHWCEEEELHTDSKGNQYYLEKFTPKSTTVSEGVLF